MKRNFCIDLSLFLATHIPYIFSFDIPPEFDLLELREIDFFVGISQVKSRGGFPEWFLNNGFFFIQNLSSRWTWQCRSRCLRHCCGTTGQGASAAVVSPQEDHSCWHVTTINQGEYQSNWIVLYTSNLGCVWLGF